MINTSTPPDLAAVKARQQATWSSGDFHAVAARIALTAEHLVDSADLHAGWRVLDVATGSGNAAIAAARLGCRVVGVDYVPALLARGRERAAAEGLDVELLEGDAEDLPFTDASFDAVVSVFGTMFAPDHEKTASELLRVSRPGGTIGLVSWTPDGFIGEMFRTISAHVPPPAGVASPLLWGTTAHLQELFGDEITALETQERTFTFRFTSAEELVDFFAAWYGPTLKALAAAPDPAALRADLVELVRRHDRLGSGAVAIPSTYLETVARRR
jgi:ubiquinone/menaquinone biosynthesis C-methylase UbiE